MNKTASQTRFTKAFQANPSGVLLILDSAGIISGLPFGFSPLFLTEHPEIIGRKLSDYLQGDSDLSLLQRLKRVSAKKKPEELVLKASDTPGISLETQLFPFQDEKILAVIRTTEDPAQEGSPPGESDVLKNYLDSAGSMFIVLKPDFSIAMINRKACEVLGYRSDSVLGKNWLPFISGQGEQKKLKILFERTFRLGQALADDFDSPVTSLGGEIRWIRWQNALLKNEAGKATGLICSGVDITEQRRAESEVRKSEARNRAILEAIPDVILLHDRQGKILKVKESARSPHCFKKSRIQGQLVTEAFPGERGTKMLNAIQESCQTGHPKGLEFDLETAGGLLSYEIRYVCMEDRKVLAVARNTTHSKATQEVLNLRNRALEAAGNGIIISDARMPDNPIIYCNEAFTDITQYTEIEALGRNCRFLQGPESDPEKVQQIRRALDQGTSCRVVLRNYRKDGSLFWNELAITPIRNEMGVLTHFIGVQNDISKRVIETERKDHTRKILEAITQDQPLSAIAGLAADFLKGHFPDLGLQIALWDKANETLETLSETGVPKIISQNLRKLSLKEDTGCPCAMAVNTRAPALLKDLKKNKATGRFVRTLKGAHIKNCWSFPVLSSDKRVLGTCTFYGSNGSNLSQEENAIISDATQLIGLAIERYLTRIHLEESNKKLEKYARNLEKDVASRTREVESTLQKLIERDVSLQTQIKTTQEAEERAQANQELFGAIARNFPKGVIMVFNTQGEYVHLEGEELHRIDLESWDFRGKTVRMTPVLSPEAMKEIEAKVSKTLMGEHPSFELQIKENTYAVNSMPLYVKDKPGWALLVLTNVTEQKKSEKDLLRALRIEQELNDLKSRFISMASHEFRTPLSAIHSSAILIGKQNEAGQEDKRLRYLRQIKNNVRNLVVILDDFLSLSALEEGNIEAFPDSFDALNLIRSVLEELESSLKVGQHFVEDFEISTLEVYQDPKLLRQVLVNLLSNAIKYAPEKSSILIAIERKDPLFSVTIEDKGMGIPAEEQPQLFDRFFRARNAINIPGTGLGLHLVKLYSELMGGSISFKSELGKGSAFTLNLPLHHKQK